MKNISEFLIKFKNLQSNDNLIEDELKEIINEVFYIDNNDYKIVFKKPYLTIKTFNPILKSEFFIKRKNIINKIEEKFGKNKKIEIFFK